MVIETLTQWSMYALYDVYLIELTEMDDESEEKLIDLKKVERTAAKKEMGHMKYKRQLKHNQYYPNPLHL